MADGDTVALSASGCAQPELVGSIRNRNIINQGIRGIVSCPEQLQSLYHTQGSTQY
jgi:hypothetical protein